MNIVHLIQSLDLAAGGPPVVAAALAIAQARLGHDVHLITYSGGVDNPDGRGVLRGMPGAELVHLHAVECSLLERFLARRASTALRSILPGTDVVHVHGVWSPIALSARRACRQAGVPYVILPHGAINEWTLVEKPLKKKIALALAFRRFISDAAWIHATSEYEARCTRTGGFHSRVEVIPLGVDVDQSQLGSGASGLTKRLCTFDGRQFAIFVARLHPSKGADVLVEAIGVLRDRGIELHAAIVGPDAGGRPDIEAAIARCDVADRVHLIGPLWGEEKFEAIRRALVFCLPSKGESFGLSIAEAMAVGTPVVISTGCHFDEVSRASAGLIVERTPVAFADAMERFVKDPSLRERASLAGMNLVAERYRWPVVAKKTIDAYQRMNTPDGLSATPALRHDRALT